MIICRLNKKLNEYSGTGGFRYYEYSGKKCTELYTFDPKPDDNSAIIWWGRALNWFQNSPTIIAYAYNMLRHATLEGLCIFVTWRIFHYRKFLVHVEERLYGTGSSHARIYYLCCRQNTVAVNNSTFTVRVTSSIGYRYYSAIAAGIGSLKGPLHGGANLQVDGSSPERKDQGLDQCWWDWYHFACMLNKEAYDKPDLTVVVVVSVVATISTAPCHSLAATLAKEKVVDKEFRFSLNCSLKIVPQRCTFMELKQRITGKTVSSNVDFATRIWWRRKTIGRF